MFRDPFPTHATVSLVGGRQELLRVGDVWRDDDGRERYISAIAEVGGETTIFWTRGKEAKRRRRSTATAFARWIVSKLARRENEKPHASQRLLAAGDTIWQAAQACVSSAGGDPERISTDAQRQLMRAVVVYANEVGADASHLFPAPQEVREVRVAREGCNGAS